MKNFGGILVLISVAYFASLSEAQYSQADNYRPGFFQQNPCVSKQTCSKCLQTPNCAWCMKEVRRKKQTILMNSKIDKKQRSICNSIQSRFMNLHSLLEDPFLIRHGFPLLFHYIKI